MNCPICATALGSTGECDVCGYNGQEGSSHRPKSVSLAVAVLAVDALFNAAVIFSAWQRAGFAAVAQNRAHWFGPFLLSLRLLLIAMVWLGNSWARTMLIVLIVLGLMNLLSTIMLLDAFGAGSLVAFLPWAGVLMQGFAAYLLFQNESLDWFR